MKDDNLILEKNACALVLGGYINGYSIVRELKDEGVDKVWLFDYGTSITRYSNKILGVTAINKTADSLKKALFKLKESFDYIVCYPTDDIQLELLLELEEDISDFCFLPFNCSNLKKCLDKSIQYQFCEKLGIPYPKTEEIRKTSDFNNLDNLIFPIIIKPNTRKDMTTSVFRSLYLENISDFDVNKRNIKSYLDQGVEFLASEFIPGDDTLIYAYTGYRSKQGEILNEWIGKKLTQFPDAFGVFSSASNEAPDIILDQGRTLLNGLDLYGIAEPEFKYDKRDGQYKLMEINLRSMMWHRVGNLSNVKLQYTQWNDAIGFPIEKYQQNRDQIIHFVYMKHEILNLLSRWGYLKFFIKNIFTQNSRYFAVLNFKDMKPFFIDLLKYPRGIAATWRKVLSKK
ncbi:hypothetical protein [Acinetobacter haemolyticus]|uniref:hypothetical protein n=1 Tax=Acinetobacter haemolyticus TaxID=29430 RepID=UPI0021CD7A5F|nr:hypothetical protein [Acinetobacter haemolyticus]MCU4377712.1 hypothetical protein [Acinetobacter haemolyticus]